MKLDFREYLWNFGKLRGFLRCQIQLCTVVVIVVQITVFGPNFKALKYGQLMLQKFPFVKLQYYCFISNSLNSTNTNQINNEVVTQTAVIGYCPQAFGYFQLQIKSWILIILLCKKTVDSSKKLSIACQHDCW